MHVKYFSSVIPAILMLRQQDALSPVKCFGRPQNWPAGFQHIVHVLQRLISRMRPAAIYYLELFLLKIKTLFLCYLAAHDPSKVIIVFGVSCVSHCVSWKVVVFWDPDPL